MNITPLEVAEDAQSSVLIVRFPPLSDGQIEQYDGASITFNFASIIDLGDGSYTVDGVSDVKVSLVSDVAFRPTQGEV